MYDAFGMIKLAGCLIGGYGSRHMTGFRRKREGDSVRIVARSYCRQRVKRYKQILIKDTPQALHFRRFAACPSAQRAPTFEQRDAVNYKLHLRTHGFN